MVLLYEIGQKPTIKQIDVGEEAYNLKDKKRYTRDKWDNIIQSGEEPYDDSLTIVSDIDGLTGATTIANIVNITQAGYDAIGTPDANTWYVITD